MTVSTRSVKLVGWEGFAKEEDRTFGQKKVIAMVPVRDIDLLARFCRFLSVIQLAATGYGKGTSTVCFPARYRIAAVEERDVTLPCLFSNFVTSLWRVY